MPHKFKSFAFPIGYTENIMDYGDPLQPFVLGSFFDGLSGAGGGANNDVKSLTSREGSMLKFDDGDKSAKLNDASENYLLMDGSGNTRLNAPNLLHLVAKNLVIDVSNDMTVNVNNDLLMNVAEQAVFNVFQKMGINTPHLQQLISSTYHTQAGKALINSQNEIKLESPEMYIAGQKKLFLTSDEQASLNSKGIVKVDGKEANKLSNKAIEYETVKEDITAKCVVHFRPLNTWKGEFGFDWMRVGDTTIEGDFPYKGNVGKYEPNKAYDEESKSEFKPSEFRQIELEYQAYSAVNIISKPVLNEQSEQVTAGSELVFEKYYVPWLSLFPATALYNPLLKATDNKAELTMLISVEVEPEKLILEYDKNLFTTSITEITAKSVTPCDPHELKLTIECKNSFDTDQIIRVYAISKTEDGKEEKLLAGMLRVMKNNEIKTANIVFVNAGTNINKVINPKKEYNEGLPKGKVEGVKENIIKYFKQALIIPNVEYEEKAFDLTTPERKRRLLDYNTVKFGSGTNYLVKTNPTKEEKPLADYLESEFDTEKEKYKDYIKVFFLYDTALKVKPIIIDNKITGVEMGKILGGYAKDIPDEMQMEPVKAVCIFHFNFIDYSENTTISHELMHAMGLRHSFDSNGRFTFPIGYTENIMDYSSSEYKLWNKPSENTTVKEVFSTWKWQWDILRKHLK